MEYRAYLGRLGLARLVHAARFFGHGATRGHDTWQMYLAAIFFMIWLSSLFIHFVWLVFSELSERAIQREIERQWQLAALVHEKPKRGMFRLGVMGDDGDLQNFAAARH